MPSTILSEQCFIQDQNHLAVAHRNRSMEVARRLQRKKLTNAKPNILHEDPSQEQVDNCIFLDDHSTVLAWSNGRATLLPVSHPTPTTSVRVCRPSAHGPSPALFRLDDGRSFVAGFRSGEVRIVSTETQKLLHSTPLGHGWLSRRLRRPLRKYDPIPQYSLKSQWLHPKHVLVGSVDWEIGNWSNVDKKARYNLSQCSDRLHNRELGWDVYAETASRPQAVHVGERGDVFILRRLDETSCEHQNIAIDVHDYQNSAESEYHDVCFVNENMIATSQQDGCIKTWDSRMLYNAKRYVFSFPLDRAEGVVPHRICNPRKHPAMYNLAMAGNKLLAVTKDHIVSIDPFRGKIHNQTTFQLCAEDTNAQHNPVLVAIDKRFGHVAQLSSGGSVIELCDFTPSGRKRKFGSNVRPTMDAHIEDCYGCTSTKVSLGRRLLTTSCTTYSQKTIYISFSQPSMPQDLIWCVEQPKVKSSCGETILETLGPVETRSITRTVSNPRLLMVQLKENEEWSTLLFINCNNRYTTAKHRRRKHLVSYPRTDMRPSHQRTLSNAVLLGLMPFPPPQPIAPPIVVGVG